MRLVRVASRWWSQASSGLVAVAVGSLALGFDPSLARDTRAESDVQAVVALSGLPAEAQTTHRLVLAGGPFPYAKDGSVFGNRERLLPRQSRGYYREYTVPTPGLSHRGARRIVCGGPQPRLPDVCYYTQDHYASFRRIAQ